MTTKRKSKQPPMSRLVFSTDRLEVYRITQYSDAAAYLAFATDDDWYVPVTMAYVRELTPADLHDGEPEHWWICYIHTRDDCRGEGLARLCKGDVDRR